jgi:hypothetical protein
VDGDGCYDPCEWYSGFGGCDQVYGSCFVNEDYKTQECGCQAGFALQYEDNSCLDVCEVDNGGCDDTSRASCTNRYTDNNDVTCKCNPGYKGTGIGWDICQDICQIKNGGCDAASSTCRNLFNGKVDCVCKSGFTKNAAGKCVKGAGSFVTATFKNTIIRNRGSPSTFCLAPASLKAKAKVSMVKCVGDQKWSVDSRFRLVHGRSKLCLESTTTGLIINTCSAVKQQQWDYWTSKQALKPKSAGIKSCLDVNGKIIATCGWTSNKQKWY